jgi:hypothetical protein
MLTMMTATVATTATVNRIHGLENIAPPSILIAIASNPKSADIAETIQRLYPGPQEYILGSLSRSGLRVEVFPAVGDIVVHANEMVDDAFSTGSVVLFDDPNEKGRFTPLCSILEKHHIRFPYWAQGILWGVAVNPDIKSENIDSTAVQLRNLFFGEKTTKRIRGGRLPWGEIPRETGRARQARRSSNPGWKTLPHRNGRQIRWDHNIVWPR